MPQLDSLLKAAIAVRELARASFSGFRVGAAIEDEHGHIFTGCNVENASYGLTICAERVAVYKAISDGAGRLKRIVVVTDAEHLTPPCGACRQILWEFCGNADVVLADLAGRTETMTMKDLYPRPFDVSNL